MSLAGAQASVSLNTSMLWLIFFNFIFCTVLRAENLGSSRLCVSFMPALCISRAEEVGERVRGNVLMYWRPLEQVLKSGALLQIQSILFS